jgi:DNA polymerase III subunit epsilon
MRQDITKTLKGFAVIDFETTGLLYDNGDRAIQLAIIQTDFDGNITEVWSSYFNPQRSMGAQDIHGITSNMVRGKPKFKELKSVILEKIKDRVIVAHNYDFDGNFLAKEMAIAKIRFDAYTDSHYLCTQKTAVNFLPHLHSHRLAACLAEVGITFDGGGTGKHHDAEADAIATSKLLKYFIYLNKEKLLGHVQRQEKA